MGPGRQLQGMDFKSGDRGGDFGTKMAEYRFREAGNGYFTGFAGLGERNQVFPLQKSIVQTLMKEMLKRIC
ncbi:hypothetical protein UZ36_00810 [Candidatus Nitromaritima sp. SCGC AAA799-C22]|nr:hypothetical protein UZ36_00810 [Candidatus Nitromaritima sp. SCGC AAA799-C22]